jgi:hypothetical protein
VSLLLSVASVLSVLHMHTSGVVPARNIKRDHLYIHTMLHQRQSKYCKADSPQGISPQCVYRCLADVLQGMSSQCAYKVYIHTSGVVPARNIKPSKNPSP